MRFIVPLFMLSFHAMAQTLAPAAEPSSGIHWQIVVGCTACAIASLLAGYFYLKHKNPAEAAKVLAAGTNVVGDLTAHLRDLGALLHKNADVHAAVVATNQQLSTVVSSAPVQAAINGPTNAAAAPTAVAPLAGAAPATQAGQTSAIATATAPAAIEPKTAQSTAGGPMDRSEIDMLAQIVAAVSDPTVSAKANQLLEQACAAQSPPLDPNVLRNQAGAGNAGRQLLRSAADQDRRPDDGRLALGPRSARAPALYGGASQGAGREVAQARGGRECDGSVDRRVCGVPGQVQRRAALGAGHDSSSGAYLGPGPSRGSGVFFSTGAPVVSDGRLRHPS